MKGTGRVIQHLQHNIVDLFPGSPNCSRQMKPSRWMDVNTHIHTHTHSQARHWRRSYCYTDVFLLLTLNIYHTFSKRFYCWLWTSKCKLGVRVSCRSLNTSLLLGVVVSRHKSCVLEEEAKMRKITNNYQQHQSVNLL